MRTWRRIRRRPVAIAGLCSVSAAAAIAVLVTHIEHDNRDISIATVAAAALGEYAISEPVILLDRPRLVLARGLLRIDSSGKSAENPVATLAGGDGRLVLESARLELEAGPVAGATDDAGLDTNAILKTLSLLKFEHLSVSDSVLIVKRAATTEQFDDVNVDLTVTRKGGMRGQGSARFRGETLTLNATVGVAKASAPEGERALTATLKGPYIEAALEGRVKTRSALAIAAPRATLSVSSLRKAAQWLGSQWPDGAGLGSFQAGGQMSWADGRLSFEQATFAIDDNPAHGNLSLSLTAGRPLIEGTLAFERFDVAPYMTQVVSAMPTAPLASTWYGLSALGGARPLSLVSEIEADLRVSAASVTMGRKPLGRGAMSLGIRNRVLAADFAEVEIEAGGTGSGRLSVDLNSAAPHCTFEARLENVEIAPIAAALFGTSVVAGKGTIEAAIEGDGTEADEIMETADGTFGVEIPHGGHLAASLARLEERAEAGASNMDWGAVAEQSTPFSTLSAVFTAEDGDFKAKKLTLLAADTAASARGTITPAKGTLQLLVGIGGAADGTLGPGAARTQIEIRGPWQSPLIRKAVSASTSAEADPHLAPRPANVLP